MEQELLTLPEHLRLVPVSGEVHVARSLVFCFVNRCLSFFLFFFSPLCCLFFDLRILIIPIGILKLFLVEADIKRNVKGYHR